MRDSIAQFDRVIPDDPRHPRSTGYNRGLFCGKDNRETAFLAEPGRTQTPISGLILIFESYEANPL
jgi:hypothetical protein